MDISTQNVSIKLIIGLIYRITVGNTPSSLKAIEVIHQYIFSIISFWIGTVQNSEAYWHRFKRFTGEITKVLKSTMRRSKSWQEKPHKSQAKLHFDVFLFASSISIISYCMNMNSTRTIRFWCNNNTIHSVGISTIFFISNNPILGMFQN